MNQYKQLFKNLKFNEKTHTYTLYDRMLVGVSTILEQKAKPFLVSWAVKEMGKQLKTDWQPNVKYTTAERNAIIDNAKLAYRRKSDKALDSGHIAHKWIERYIAGTKTPLPADIQAKMCVEAFLAWEKAVKPIWLASELKVYSVDHEYAGTLDFIAKWDNKVYLGDFKTSSRISDEYALQTAAYQNCLQEKHIKIDGRFTLRLDKETSEYEEYYVPTPFEFDFNVFLSLKQVHKWNVYNNNLEQKDRKSVV